MTFQNGSSLVRSVENGTFAMRSVENGTSVIRCAENVISFMRFDENETSVFRAVANRTSVFSSVENETSVLSSVENVTSGIIYSNEAERVFSLLYIGLSHLFTLCAQLLVLVTIIKSPKLHNAHFYLLGVYCCVDITLVSLTGHVIFMRFTDLEVPSSACH